MAKERSTQAGYQEADYLFEVICERLRRTQGQINLTRLRKAYELGLTAHEGQFRKDGNPYITHPLEVAEICADLNMNEDAIIAAILHDTVEDTPVKLPQIRAQFGPTVANMVDSLTKIKKIDFFARFLGRDKASNQARNLQKLFIAMTRDSRVIVIKLADRLHNMQTMGSMPEHKRERISKETLEFYIPLARRLGLGQMVTELEDLVFMHLYPSTYEELKQSVDKLTLPRERIVEKMIDQLRSLLLQHGIRASKIYGRRKHLYSIWQKMQRQGVDLDGIYDLLAIRLIIEGNAEDCYKVLGLLHLAYKPIFHRFRDFIGSPKENGYQTLHTSVIGPEGTIVEAQIRTVDMDLEAEKGIAAHWSYKEPSASGGTEVAKDDTWMSFIRELAEAEVGTEEFVAQTRETLLTDQVLVLSPQGEVVDLPQGSTPIDFAYYIHTDLGHSIRAAKVNGISVPLDYRLRSGDVVEVVKGPEGDKLPRPEWLVMARSPKSLLKIRRYFKGLPANERINIGRNLLRQQITKEGLYPLNLMANDKLLALLKRLSVRSIDDLYDKVAQGIYECDEIIRELKEIHISKIIPESDSLSAAPRVEVGDGRMVSVEYTRLGLASEMGIARQGGEPLRIKSELMACCTPVPPDHIYGVLDRRERRMRVHRAECERLKREMQDGELIALQWSSLPGDHQFYAARLGVISLNRVGLLFEVLRFLSQQNINIGGAQFDMSSQEASAAQYVRFELVVEVSDLDELQRCIEQIKSIDDVLEVNRIFHYQDATPGGPAGGATPVSLAGEAQPGGGDSAISGENGLPEENTMGIAQPRLPFVGPGGQGGLD